MEGKGNILAGRVKKQKNKHEQEIANRDCFMEVGRPRWALGENKVANKLGSDFEGIPILK